MQRPIRLTNRPDHAKIADRSTAGARMPLEEQNLVAAASSSVSMGQTDNSCPDNGNATLGAPATRPGASRFVRTVHAVSSTVGRDNCTCLTYDKKCSKSGVGS